VKERPGFGHGYGKKVFEHVYYASNPPAAQFHYPHPHEFWLKLLFEFGWTGLVVNAVAWLLLASPCCGASSGSNLHGAPVARRRRPQPPDDPGLRTG